MTTSVRRPASSRSCLTWGQSCQRESGPFSHFFGLIFIALLSYFWKPQHYQYWKFTSVVNPGRSVLCRQIAIAFPPKNPWQWQEYYFKNHKVFNASRNVPIRSLNLIPVCKANILPIGLPTSRVIIKLMDLKLMHFHWLSTVCLCQLTTVMTAFPSISEACYCDQVPGCKI